MWADDGYSDRGDGNSDEADLAEQRSEKVRGLLHALRRGDHAPPPVLDGTAQLAW